MLMYGDRVPGLGDFMKYKNCMFNMLEINVHAEQG